MAYKKTKARSGIWVTRELIRSPAYWALSKTGKGLLLLFLDKRDMSKNHELLNRRDITLTYLELENIFGTDAFGNSLGLSRGSITRGIEDLLAKGFIEIVKQGGAYKRDKTVYGLTEDWKYWVPGKVIRTKEKGRASGYFALKRKSEPPQPDSYTPPQPEP